MEIRPDIWAELTKGCPNRREVVEDDIHRGHHAPPTSAHPSNSTACLGTVIPSGRSNPPRGGSLSSAARRAAQYERMRRRRGLAPGTRRTIALSLEETCCINQSLIRVQNVPGRANTGVKGGRLVRDQRTKFRNIEHDCIDIVGATRHEFDDG